MQNKLEFADGTTWEYTWYRYFAKHSDSTTTGNKHWPIDQNLYVYRSSQIIMAGIDENGYAKYTFKNVQLALTNGKAGTVNPELSTTKPLQNYYWFFSDDNTLTGDYVWEHDNFTELNCLGYSGETTFQGSGDEIRIVTAANPPVDTSYYDITFERTNVYSTDKNAYPWDGLYLNYWYIMHQLPDNWIFTDSDIIGGVNYTYNINTNENITIGQSACARIEFYTQTLDNSFQGRTCTYYVKQSNDNDYRKIGVFYIAKAERLSSTGKYKMIGYDNVYRLNTIIDDWLYHTSYDSNRYNVWDSGLSKSSLSNQVFMNDENDSIILWTDLVLQYNSSASTADSMWRWAYEEGTSSAIEIPAREPNAETKAEIVAWLDNAKGKILFIAEHDQPIGTVKEVDAFAYYTGSNSISWTESSSYNVSLTLTSAAKSLAPYYARENNVYYTELDEIKTYNEHGQVDYPSNAMEFSGNKALIYYRNWHRDPVVVNGTSTPTLILSSICSELGLSYDSTLLHGPVTVYFGFSASGITATAMLSYLAEVCGGYLAADVDGKIMFKFYKTANQYSLDNTKYKTYTYQDEAVKTYAPQVIIKQDESDSNGVVSTNGSDKKLYITKNPWTLGTTQANIKVIADAVYQTMKEIFGTSTTNTYTPMTIELLQDFGIAPGDKITVNGVTTYVMSKRMNQSGVVLESTGTNNEEIETVAQIESANNLNGKDIILTSYDYNNEASASLTIKGNDGSIYITTTGSGHVYVNGNILV